MSEKVSEEQKTQALQIQYNNFQEALTELQTQLSSITSQAQEHGIVDKTLSSIPPEKRGGRKCFKMIGGVLVEKSVDDVIKLLDEEKKELEASKTALEKELVETKRKMDEWITKNKVKVVKQ